MIPFGIGRGTTFADQENLGRLVDRQVLARLAGFLRPHWRRLTIAIVTMFAYTAAAVAVPWLVRLAIDSYIQAKDLSGLDLLFVIFLIVASLGAVGYYLHQRMLQYVSQQVLYSLRVRMFNHLQKLSMSYYDRNEAGQIMSRVQNDVQQLQGATATIIFSLADVISLGGVVAAMFVMSPRLAVITLLVIIPLTAVLTIWQRFAAGVFRRVQETTAELNSRLLGTIAGIRVVQSLNREPDNMRRLARANDELVDAQMQTNWYLSALPAAVEVLGAGALALVVYFGGSMVLDGSIEVGIVVAFVLYIERFFDPIRNLTLQYSLIQIALASGSRIFELLDLQPEVKDKPDAIQLPPVQGEVRYEGVGFHYSPGVPVLEEFNLHIRAGETVALVGPTGAGKTTMVSLLLRLYDVSEGRITVDGHDVRDVSHDSLTSQMSVVLQEPYLFTGTVMENIRYNHAEVTDEEIVTAATAVGAHEFINRMEQGYDTPLQERGGNLSIGERQLISFARAVAANPRILILDEATARVDTNSEIQIQQALSGLLRDRTALVIAHRLSTVRNADRIAVLDQGRIVEQGTHDQLMANDGLYARLQSYTADGA